MGLALKPTLKIKTLTAAALGVAAVLPIHGARAEDTAAELRELKARLDATIGEVHSLKARLQRYEGKSAAQDRKLTQVSNETRNHSNTANSAEVTKGPATLASFPYTVNIGHGLTVESLDHANSFHVGGRVYVDGGGSTQPERGLSETANLAQARLQVEGRLHHIWEYRFQYDFVGNIIW